MFFRTKRDNQLIDFLAQFSVFSRCATEEQMELILKALDTKQLKMVQRFLSQQSMAESQIKSRSCTDNGSNSALKNRIAA